MPKTAVKCSQDPTVPPLEDVPAPATSPPLLRLATAEAGGVLARQHSFRFSQALGAPDFGCLWPALREAERPDTLTRTLAGPSQRCVHPVPSEPRPRFLGADPALGIISPVVLVAKDRGGQSPAHFPTPSFSFPEPYRDAPKGLGIRRSFLILKSSLPPGPGALQVTKRGSPSCLI